MTDPTDFTAEEVQEAMQYCDKNYFPDHRYIPAYATILARALRSCQSKLHEAETRAIKERADWIIAFNRAKEYESKLKESEAKLIEIVGYKLDAEQRADALEVKLAAVTKELEIAKAVISQRPLALVRAEAELASMTKDRNRWKNETDSVQGHFNTVVQQRDDLRRQLEAKKI